jgi:hypothetical protein
MSVWPKLNNTKVCSSTKNRFKPVVSFYFGGEKGLRSSGRRSLLPLRLRRHLGSLRLRASITCAAMFPACNR